MGVFFEKNSSRSRGFIFVSFLILSSVFVSAFSLSYVLLRTLKNKSQAYSLCYKAGFKIQSQLKEKLKTLVSMNHKALFLRIKRKAAQAKYYAALSSLNPFAVSEALVELKKVKAEQKTFKAIQKSIFIQSRTLILKEWSHFKLKSSKYLKNLSKKQSKVPLAVEPKPKESDSPSYIPVKSFSKNQNIKISWTMDMFQFLPKKNLKHLDLKGGSSHHCSVSLEGANKNFQIRLMK